MPRLQTYYRVTKKRTRITLRSERRLICHCITSSKQSDISKYVLRWDPPTVSEHEEYYRIMGTINENHVVDEESLEEGQDRSIKTRSQQKVTDFYNQKFVEENDKEIEKSQEKEDQRLSTENDRTKQYHSSKTCSKTQVSAKFKKIDTTPATEKHVDRENPRKNAKEIMKIQRTQIKESETRSYAEQVQNERETEVFGENSRERRKTKNDNKNFRKNSEERKKYSEIRSHEDQVQNEITTDGQRGNLRPRISGTNRKELRENPAERAGEGLEDIPTNRDTVRQQGEGTGDTYETCTRRRTRRNPRTPRQARRR